MHGKRCLDSVNFRVDSVSLCLACLCKNRVLRCERWCSAPKLFAALKIGGVQVNLGWCSGCNPPLGLVISHLLLQSFLIPLFVLLQSSYKPLQRLSFFSSISYFKEKLNPDFSKNLLNRNSITISKG